MDDRFAGYILLERINEKRNYVTYRGIKESDGYPCSIKLLKLRHPALSEIARFKQEYSIIRALDIGGIVKVVDLLEQGNEFAIVEEAGAGISLREILQKKNLDCESFLRIAISLSKTLGQLHAKNSIHMDVKPESILVHENSDKVKISDFGIIAAFTHGYEEIYKPEVIEGSLFYMSPEQTGRINQQVDYRTDLYSLGITFYEMLAGKTPFVSCDPMEIIYSHIARIPERLDHIDAAIPPVIADIVAMLLAKNPEERYQNSFGLMLDLQKCLARLKNRGRVGSFPLGEKDIAIKFNIPQRTVGRQKEIDALLALFEAVNSGEEKKQLILVSGAPGIGKTAIINKLQKPILARKGYFISGKYDLFRRDVPYSGIIQAFQGLIRQILAENEGRIEHWKELILKAVGTNGKIITNVIPVVELLIGKQPDVPALEPEQTQNRFTFVFKCFVDVFASKENPLVLFLDDLQWADIASMLFIKKIITDPDIRFLFLIGAYRDNEVNAIHPFMRMIEEIKKEGTTVQEMPVTTLSVKDVNQLISNFLRCNEKRSLPLAEIVIQKTNGNPFFMNQFLKTLYEEHILELKPVVGWTWDMEKINALRVTDNVIELMAGKIEKLPPDIQQVVKVGGCIGTKFDIETIAHVIDKSIDATYILLAGAIKAGLVSEYGDIYTFYHDRIQEAACSLIPEDERVRLHYKIGKYILQNAKGDELHNKIIYIVDQINLATSIIIDADDRYEVARLNLMAGDKAMAFAAYESALTYYKAGISFLSEKCWETQYNLALSLYTEATEAEYLCLRFTEIEKYAAAVKKHAKTIYDRIYVHVTEIKSLIVLNKPQEAVRMSLYILKLLDLRISESPKKLDLILILIKIKLIQLRKRKEDLLKLNDNPSLLRKAQTAVLSILATPAYTSNPELSAAVSLQSIYQIMKDGPLTNSAIGYVGYALILCNILYDIDASYEFGQMALQLIQKPGTEKVKACALCTVNGFIVHWKNHIRSTLQPLLDAYQIGIETGDLEYATLAIQFYIIHLFSSGHPLADVERQLTVYYEIIKKLKYLRIVQYLESMRQMMHNLLDERGYLYIISDEIADEEKIMQIHAAANDRSALCGYYLSKFIFSYSFYKYPEARTYAEKNKEYLDASRGSIIFPLFYFYDSLSQLALIDDARKSNNKRILRNVLRNQKKMKIWAHHSPLNYLHKYHLVEAEIVRIRGKYADAEELYDRAIEEAHTNLYLQDEALANELAAKFYLSRDKKKIAATYMNEAHSCYIKWGAKAKLKHLEENYPELLHVLPCISKIVPENESGRALESTDYVSTSKLSGMRALDISTIIKISLAISGEINLGKLLEIVMKLVIENAGAQKGFMILDREEGKGLCIEAESIDGVGIEVLQSLPLKKSKNLSVSIVNYVKKMSEPVALNDVSCEGLFNRDPYVIENKPKSILCTPIKYKGKTFGVLYLENNLAPNAFIPERVELLSILSSQAAIAIENAILYEKAINDGLTGVYNKTYFDNYLMKMCRKAQQNKKRLSLLIIDIDDFKIFNDTFGHQLGDAILVKVAKMIRNSAGERSMTARYGGEEFAVVLDGTGLDEARIIAERIRKTIEENFLEYAENDAKKRVPVTVSIGIAELTGSGNRVEFIEMADKQMYKAKMAGKNKICPSVCEEIDSKSSI